MAQVTSSATRSKRSTKKPVTQGQNPQRANRQRVASKLLTRGGSSAVNSPTGSGRVTYSDDRGKSTSGTGQNKYQQERGIKRPSVTTGSAGSRVTTGDNRPTGSTTNRNITSSQQRGLRTRAAQATGRGGATATGTGARPANQPRGGAPVTQGTGGSKPPQGAQLRIGGAGRLGAAAAGIQAYNTGDSTLKAAQKRGDYKPKQGPADPDRGLSKASSFDKAFAAARKSGKKTFDWNGKKYTTETK